jgi:hypothetical protein
VPTFSVIFGLFGARLVLDANFVKIRKRG